MKTEYIQSIDNRTFSSIIYLVNDFDSIQNIGLSESVIQLFEKKRLNTSLTHIWVETVETVFFFVLANSKNNYELIDKIRQEGNKIYAASNIDKVRDNVAISNINADIIDAHAFLEGFLLSEYSFDNYKKTKKTNISSVSCIGNFNNTNNELETVCNAVFTARNLINEPVCTLNSTAFANEIAAIFKGTEAEVKIYEKEWIEEQKMGGLLAINKGSIDPPLFVHISWNPTKSTDAPIVLVGKGIVYDTGGLSLKTPSTYMETMKADMGGAAAVIGCLQAIVNMNVQLKIDVLIPITDNRPGGNAIAPGDVVTMHNGTTVEILNTDAEGRMILGDALSFAQSLQPKLTIDIATLTGAANAAVGEHAAVCMGTDKNALDLLEKSGLETWEPVVEFPIWNYYNEQLKSEIADLKNVGGPLAGSITAGKFLEHFVTYPWIHLDISGSTFLKTKSTYKGVGGTAFGVRLLYNCLKAIKDAKIGSID